MWCSIEEVIAAAIDDLRLQPERLSLALDRDLPLVRADAAQLERAFANLLENAVRHSGGHPVSVRAARDRRAPARPRRRPRAGHPAGAARPRVRAVLPRRTASAGHRGSGLGLAIVRGFVEANGGRVSAESLPGQGTSFVVEFPGELLRRRRAGAEQHRVGHVSAKQRVLVCDDEPQILRALRVILRDAGFEVDPASTAAEALDQAAVRPPNAAIIDLVLPDGDGIEVCRQLREWTAIPIIVLSAVGEEDQKVRALEAGADDYVTKPFGSRELVARLQAALRRAAPTPDEPVLRADGLEVDLAAHRVHRDGEEVHLTPIEFELLAVLTRNRGRLMTHRALLTEVWGPAYADDTATLRTHIANLRRKIEPSGGGGATSAPTPASATASAF